MKRNFLTTLVLLFFVTGIHAQPLVYEPTDFNMDKLSLAIPGLFGGNNVQDGINLGLSISAPTNSANTSVPVGVVFEANYLYQSRRALAVGFTTGYGAYFHKEDSESWGPIKNNSDFRFLPLAAATRYAFNNGIVLGADVGCAFVLSSNWKGGFYYRPILGYNISKNMQINTSYSGIVTNWTWSTINFGITYNINS